MRSTALEAVPEAFRQSEQWHWPIPLTFPSISKRTSPQRQLPRITTASSLLRPRRSCRPTDRALSRAAPRTPTARRRRRPPPGCYHGPIGPGGAVEAEPLVSSAPAWHARNVGQETLVRSAPAGVSSGGGGRLGSAAGLETNQAVRHGRDKQSRGYDTYPRTPSVTRNRYAVRSGGGVDDVRAVGKPAPEDQERGV